jgi:hypothetical protein
MNQLTTMSLFSKSSQQPIPVELLGSAVEAIAELPAEDRKNTASRVVALLRMMMDAHNVSSAKDRSALVTGIQFGCGCRPWRTCRISRLTGRGR